MAEPKKADAAGKSAPAPAPAPASKADPAAAAAASTTSPSGSDKDKEKDKTKGAEAPEVKERKTKRSPNRLIVDDAHGEGDNSCVMLSMAKMDGSSHVCCAVRACRSRDCVWP